MNFNVEEIEKHGWRQGGVLGPELQLAAREWAPLGLTIVEHDWIIVASHDCDILNDQLSKEPFVEVLRGVKLNLKTLDQQMAGGRNPRGLQIEVKESSGNNIILSIKAHERWTLPRQILCKEPPRYNIGEKERSLLAKWIANRYIRPAFPTNFDRRWRAKLRDWTRLLENQSQWIQGVYLRLNTLDEVDERTPYIVDIIVAAPRSVKKDSGWSTKKYEIEREINAFWMQFRPSIHCADVALLGTDQITLADLERYQRFDADWVSFADESPTMPAVVDSST